jgi:tagatose-1,6-bisphosphate aldolase
MPELAIDQENPASGVLAERATQLAIIKQHLEAAQERMKWYADKHCTDQQFKVGELVLLRLQPYA